MLCLLLCPAVLSCEKREPHSSGARTIKVVTTLFPLYDFARNVGGELVQVELLLPPGMEPHSFEPKPADIRKINDADLFLYTGEFMEPWVTDVLKGISNKTLRVVDASAGIVLAEDYSSAGYQPSSRRPQTTQGHHHEQGRDPHIWLDFANAETMVRNICNGLIAKDPANRSVYARNAEEYAARLFRLDRQFRDSLAGCRSKTIIHGGHSAFGYLAKRYHLQYLSAYRGFSPNAEPTPGNLIQLIEHLRSHHVKYMFFEELVAPNVSETIARETGAKLLMLHGAHNVSKDEWDQDVTFLSLMENNLKNLRIGLECR